MSRQLSQDSALSTQHSALIPPRPSAEGPLPRIGAHVSTAGGLASAVERALAIGAQSLQIFVGAPQTWAEARYGEEEVRAFREGVAAHRLGPVFIHAPYLVNLGTPRDDLWTRSWQTLARQLAWADRIGAVGVIVHAGSAGAGSSDTTGAQARVAAALRRVLTAHTGAARLILENDAGAGARLGARLPELASLIAAAGGDSRLGICLDTAHAFAAGYDLLAREGLAIVLGELEQLGADRFLVVHANDSRTACGSHRDRHENIGDGRIGSVGLRILAQQALLRERPWILEVPGLAGQGPDAENVVRLRRIMLGRAPSRR